MQPNLLIFLMASSWNPLCLTHLFICLLILGMSFRDARRLEEGEGNVRRYRMNVCALGGKERGGLRPR